MSSEKIGPDETAADRDARQLRSVRTYLTTVVGVEDVHASLRRITFAAGDLRDFRPLGPDTFLYLLLPPPGQQTLTVGRSFTWQAYARMPEADRPVGAYYTLRSWRPETSELDLLFALHDPAGHATTWARRAEAGDRVALWGPRATFDPPPGTDWFLLVADDTGLPAVGAILETLPPHVPVTVVAEVACREERHPLPTRSATQVIWLHRDGAPAGTIASRVADVLGGLRQPEGDGYVWAGAERDTVKAVRRHAGEIGVPTRRTSLVAYWRREPDEAADG